MRIRISKLLFTAGLACGILVAPGFKSANAICARLQVTCTFQNQDWDGIIPSLLSNKFDVIFSEVYYATPPVFVAQATEKSTDVSPCTERQGNRHPILHDPRQLPGEVLRQVGDQAVSNPG